MQQVPPHWGNRVGLVMRSQARIGCSVRPMGVRQCRKTIVLRVRVKSRLFLVGPALLAISVSGRAEQSGGEGAGLEGPDFSFLQLASDKSLFFSSSSVLSADNTIGSHHHLPSGFSPSWMHGGLFSWIIFKCLDSDCLQRLVGVNGLCLAR